MQWDGFFDDLEDQLDAEQEAERAALDAESERLRLSRMTLTDRLRALAGPCGPEIVIDVGDGDAFAVRLTAVGIDWAGFTHAAGAGGAGILPLHALRSVAADEGDLLAAARADVGVRSGLLRERMSLGFVLRDVARRRAAVTVHVRGGRAMSGTIDRALSDHLDVALHDAGAPRRAALVHGTRLVPLDAISWVHLHGPGAPT